jgi:hypothetical protein
MDKHIKALGILHIAYGCLRLLGVLGIGLCLSGLGYWFEHAHWPAPLHDLAGLAPYQFISLLAYVFMTAALALGIAGIVAGCGLLSRKEWARLLALIVGVLSLLKIPFGTALGIYTIWVMTQPQTKQLMVS